MESLECVKKCKHKLNREKRDKVAFTSKKSNLGLATDNVIRSRESSDWFS